jgi:O-acetyl-ADP-ribose deacetylase (regulator of RNase III)
MIKKGNIFESDAQTLVITVNCVGVMGKGLALEFKKRYPEMFNTYKSLCKNGKIELGKPHYEQRMFPPSIVFFPTKEQ